MKSEDNTQKLMSGLRHLFKNDKVTTTLIDITKLGLVEVTRKREGVTLLQALKILHFKGVDIVGLFICQILQKM